MRIAIQTYTVRRALSADFAGTLDAIKALGIGAVELARIGFTTAEARLVAASGLTVTSIQVKPERLAADPVGIAAFCRAVGCRTVVVSVLSKRAILGGARAVKHFALFLNRLSDTYAAAGLTMLFHHHDYEFAKVGKRRKIDVLIETAPTIRFVVDTYWTAKSGVDPAAWIERLGFRAAGLHLRDCIRRKGLFRPAHDAPLGAGAIDFSAVLAAARHADYAAIEQNSGHPFDDLAKSIAHLKSIAMKDINI